MTRTVWESKKTPVATGYFAWDALDDECLREGEALQGAFHTTAVKGTPKRKAKVAGGPENRKRRATLAAST